MKCAREFKLKVLKSAAGYYIGTIDEDGFPYCRLSAEYYDKDYTAEEQLFNNCFAIRKCIENQFCANGINKKHCIER